VSTLDQFKQSTLRQTIWKTIREAILRGELAPGSPINQASLAARFGVSRGPLREALSSLEKEGLVTNIPYRGTFVADFDDRIITETYSVRRVLEAFAAELAIQNGTAQQMAELRDIFSEMAEVADRAGYGEIPRTDLQLIRHIYLMADHELLLQMWNAIETNVKRGIFLRAVFASTRQASCWMRIIRIVEAFEVRDVEAAKREIDTLITTDARG